MSDADTTARPRQLVTAAGFVIVGSALLVVAVFDRLASLQSVDTRDAVTRFLQNADWLGMGVDSGLTVMRIGLNLAAVCAAAAVVLGVFVLQRHRGARVALAVLAAPILLTSPLTGSLLGAVVAAAIAMLWTGPAGDWYAGRAVRQAPQDSPRTERSSRPEHAEPSGDTESSQPGPRPDAPTLSTDITSAKPSPSRGYGEVPAVQSVPSAVGANRPASPEKAPAFRDPGWTDGPAYVPSRLRSQTPVAVKVACVLTWVFSVAVVAVVVVAMVAVTRDTGALLADLRGNATIERAGLTSDGLVAILWLVVVTMAGWAAGAMVLAWFVWRRHDWARYLLVLSAAAVFVAAVFAFPVGLPLQAVCVTTIVLLLTPSSRAWFDEGTQPPDRPVW